MRGEKNREIQQQNNVPQDLLGKDKGGNPSDYHL